MRRRTHIVVIDGEGLARDGLCALLQREAGLQLCASFDSPREAVRADADLAADIILIDFALAMRNGPHTLAHLKRRWPQARVLVLSLSGEGAKIEAARRAGADGFILRNDRRQELTCALEALAERRHYISTSVLKSRAAAPAARSLAPLAPHGPAMLTDREQEVVALIAEGYRTREMAQLLAVSHKTVERHRTNLMRKLGVRSATGVVAYALTHRYTGF